MTHQDGARPLRLIGREEELHTLQSALRSSPSLTLLVGEAGTGKSRLLTEAAQTHPTPWLTGYCRPVRGQSPLTPLAEALASTQTGLLGSTGFSGLMATLASLGPVVLVLEDLHWAESATLQLLRLVAGRLPKDLRLVGTYRPEDTLLDADITTLAGCVPPGTRTTEVRLDPLSRAEVGELAADLLGIDRIPAGLAQDLHARSGGLPFVVAEYLRADRGGGAGKELNAVRIGREGVAKAVERAIAETRAPVALRASVTLRLENVPDACRQLVWAAAVIDAPSPETVLGAVAGIAENDRPDAIDTALARGLLGQPRPGLYDLRHALARRAIHDAIPPTRLRRLHRRTAEVLSDLQPIDHRRIAEHFRHGGHLQGWLRHAELAATRSATSGDVAAAADQLVELVRVRALPWADRARVAAHLGHLSIGTRRWIDAVAILRHVLAEAPDAPSTSRGQARFALGTLLVESAGQIDAGRRLIAESFDELAPTAPTEAARAAAYLAIPTSGPEPFTRHRAWLRRATELAPGDPTVQHLLRLGESPVDRAPRIGDLFASGHWAELERELMRARTEAVHRPLARAEVQLVEGRLRLAQGNLASAKDLLGAVEGDLRVRHAAVASLARMRVLQDRPEAAWRTVEESVDVVRHKHGWVWSAESIVVACQALVQLDRFDDAAAILAEMAAALADCHDEVALAALEYARAVVGESVSFKQVAATYRELGRPYDQYLALEHAARQELRDGKPDLLVTLAADFDRLGARWDARRCRQTLREAGVAAPGRRGRRGYGNALSPRELEVARLAARGLSNSRIATELTLSVSTIEDHLSRALRKLRITSRRDLAPLLPPDPERDH